MKEKEQFLRNQYSHKLAGIDPATAPLWGKMNVQQMVEHMADSIRQAYGEPAHNEILTPAENLPKMQAFLLSDKPFRENTPNAMLPDVPPPPKHAHMTDSLTELRDAVSTLFSRFGDNPGLVVTNPFFGNLDYAHTIHLLHKHAWHHLRQFGVAE